MPARPPATRPGSGARGPRGNRHLFRADINGLRAVAVVAVVLYHFGVPGIAGGYVGVDVFFAISGYLMTQIAVTRLERGSPLVLAFYAARARRIVPALYVMLALLSLAGAAWLTPLELRQLGKQAIAAAGFFSNHVYAGEGGYFARAAHEKWLLHSWSLAVEWQFYLVFPLLAAALWRLGRQRALVAGLGVLLLVSFAASVLVTRSAPAAAYFLLPSRAWEMLAGSVAWFVAARIGTRAAPLLPALGLVLIAAAALSYTPQTPFPGVAALLPVAGACLVLVRPSPAGLLAAPPLQWLGTISYSLYLWHWPVVVAVRYAGLPLSAPAIVAMCVVALALAQASYRFVEQPTRHALQDAGLRRAATALVAAGGLTLAMPLAAYVTNGLPQRVPGQAAQVLPGNDGLHDSPWSYPQACSNFQLPLAGGQARSCRLGDGDGTLVWGDSHAEQLYPLLASFKDRGFRFATNAGCVPVRHLNRVAPGFDCDLYAEQFLRLALAPEVQHVVIAGSWLNALHGPELQAGGPPDVCHKPSPQAACEAFASPAAALAFMELQLREDLRTLTRAGKRVTLVLPFPVHQVDVPRYLARRQFHGQTLDYTLSSEAFDASATDARRMLERAAHDAGAQTLDPAAVLCASGACIYQHGGRALYRDSHHLVAEGAQLLRPSFERLFAEPPASTVARRPQEAKNPK
ncbi:hypothetical protein CKO43_22615 [Rubrivivax gelatinosus]|uniref:Acyltransferase n=1 Tax=Rubrivivax gelatinosus TaxID=28068 RepID=A0ABS1E1U5_RUBGE|nr:hypothetical protein [Rubrivivax gelatinosus]